MNRKEYFGSCLSYGLKVMRPDGKTIQQIYGIDKYNLHFYEQGDIRYGDINKSVPIVRSLDDLLKECTQSDYNEGNPFIPMLELAKMKGWSWGVIKDGKCYVTQILYGGTSFTETFHYSDNEGFYTITDDDYYTGDEHKVEKVGIKFNHFLLYQQLLKWHFWPNMPEGEKVVLVTETFNTYNQL